MCFFLADVSFIFYSIRIFSLINLNNNSPCLSKSCAIYLMKNLKCIASFIALYIQFGVWWKDMIASFSKVKQMNIKYPIMTKQNRPNLVTCLRHWDNANVPECTIMIDSIDYISPHSYYCLIHWYSLYNIYRYRRALLQSYLLLCNEIILVWPGSASHWY